jgi:hypothetical protein
MVRVISPEVNFLSYGPVVKLKDNEGKETVLTPDDLVYAASGVTFKGMKFINEVIDMKKEGVDFESKKVKSIIKSAGAGHASLSTSIGFWSVLQGDGSKLVDSIFTGATYISALMPSGRRVPICEEEIVVPKSIANKGGGLLELYMDVSRENIKAYEFFQANGVPKQEASKIVQYGHSGGGFLFMPLETLAYFSKLAESNPEDMPLEGREIIKQLEKLVNQNGMGVVYESRKNAPRAGNVNPNIFHHRVTFAEELANEVEIEEIQSPIITYEHDFNSEERARRIAEYIKHRKELFEHPGQNWEKSLRELENIVTDFNDSVSIQTLVNTPWRVWGEVKRHRTLRQNSQSIYKALDEISSSLGLVHPSEFISVPLSVERNKSNLDLWQERANESILAYETLTNAGISESDAIALIPRGIKFNVIKNFDLYNLTTGYASLRTCRGTVEPEMRAITEKEMALVRQSEEIGNDVKDLLAPKCHYSGFCPESDYKTCCGLVGQVVPKYDEEMHKAIWVKRETEIRAKL